MTSFSSMILRVSIWDANPSQNYSMHLIVRYQIIHLAGERHCESYLSCPITQNNVPGLDLKVDRSIWRRVHKPWGWHSSTLAWKGNTQTVQININSSACTIAKTSTAPSFNGTPSYLWPLLKSVSMWNHSYENMFHLQVHFHANQVLIKWRVLLEDSFWPFHDPSNCS